MDNQQFPPIVPQPEETKSLRQKLSDVFNRYKLWISVGVVGLMLVIGWVLFASRNQSSEMASNDSPKTSQFKNWLAPTKELKVGQFRYVSTCQVLTVNDVISQFGDYSDDGIVMEDFLDDNYTAATASDSFEGQCSYELKNQKYRNVALRSKQFSDANEARKVFNFAIAKPEALKPKVDAASAAASSDEATQAFVARLKESADKYPELSKLTYKPDELSRTSVDGLILPGPTRGYILFYQNGVYILEISPTSRDAKDTEFLAEYGQTLQTIETNLKKSDLDQSPAPTVIGKHDVVTGTTKVIESCSILTRTAFTTITGTEQDKPTSRTSLPWELKDRVQDKQRMVANACERLSGKGSKNPSNRVNITLRHASSEQGAIAWLGSDQGTTPLTTDADQSFVLNPRFEGDYPIYYFRVGPYVADIDISQTSSDGTFSGISQKEATTEQYVKAINVLVAELRKYQ